MSAFQDMMDADMAIFCNPDEFGEMITFVYHEGSSVDIAALVTTDPPMRAGSTPRMQAARTTILIARSSITRKPILDGDKIVLTGRGDTKQWTVVKLERESDKAAWHMVVI